MSESSVSSALFGDASSVAAALGLGFWVTELANEGAEKQRAEPEHDEEHAFGVDAVGFYHFQLRRKKQTDWQQSKSRFAISRRVRTKLPLHFHSYKTLTENNVK